VTPASTLEDIAEAAEAIARYVHGVTSEDFARDDEKRSAVERQLFIIGEAVAHLPDEVTEQEPEIPWRRIVGLRNILAHGYWRIDEDELWDVAVNKVPPLAIAVTRLVGGASRH
jgi:uncharacterized protein with HEPN domain